MKPSISKAVLRTVSLVVMIVFLSSCGSSSSSTSKPKDLIWDETNWNEVNWQ